MRMDLSLAAAAVLVAVTAGISLAEEAQVSRDRSVKLSDTTWFDLGIDLVDVQRDAGSVKIYLASLPAVTRTALTSGCADIMKHPWTAQSPLTLSFCSLIP